MPAIRKSDGEAGLYDLVNDTFYTNQGEGKFLYPYQLNSIEDLVRLEKETRDGDSKEGITYVLIKNLDFNDDASYENPNDTTEFGDYNADGTIDGIKTELTKRVDVDGKLTGFYGIGGHANRFRGNFDGQNHRIDNLYINNNINDTSTGFIRNSLNNIIKNLTISGEIINRGTAATNLGIIGSARGNVVLENITNEATITNLNGSYRTGGIVGTTFTYSGNDTNSLTIINCVNKGEIFNGYSTGGLVGRITVPTTIENSHNEGNLTKSKGYITGGLVGEITVDANNVNINNSYNTGSITLNTTTTNETVERIGGAIGYLAAQANITNFYNTGDITNIRTDYSNYSANIHASGIVAGHGSSLLIIRDSYNSGNISNGTRTGGILAYTAGTVFIYNTYNTGNIAINLLINSDYSHNAGGIVARNYCGNAYILNSYNTGSVSQSNNSTMSYSGGILGYSHINCSNGDTEEEDTSTTGEVVDGKTIILNSYNTGSVQNNLLSNYAGGIIGTGKATKLSNVFNTGDVTSQNKKYSIGALNSESILENAYYKSGEGITATGNSALNDLATAKTASEINLQSFASELNTNKNNISLSLIDSALSGYTLSSWELGSNGYPVLDN